MDVFGAVDDLLASRFHVGLEEALCDGCLSGRLPLVLADDAEIIRRCMHTQIDEDGGQSFTYEGVFIIAGVRYNFRCYIFVDTSGQRFVSDVASFDAVDWRIKIAM